MQETMCVEKVMTKPVVVVDQAATIAHAAKLLLDNRISGLPVVGAGGNKKVLDDEPLAKPSTRSGLSSFPVIFLKNCDMLAGFLGSSLFHVGRASSTPPAMR